MEPVQTTRLTTKRDEEKMVCFNEEYLDEYMDPFIENGTYKRRTSGEVKQIYQKPDINT